MADGPRRAMVWVLCAQAATAPWLFSTRLSDAFEAPKAFHLHAFALLLVGLGLWRRLRDERGPLDFARDPVCVAAAALLASAALSTAASVHPYGSWTGAFESELGLWSLLCLGALFLATRTVATEPGDLRRIVAAICVGTAGSCAYALAQAGGLDVVRWQISGPLALRPFAGFGNANFLAAYLATALPLCAWLALDQRDRGHTLRALACGATVIAAGASLVLCMSRAGWLAGGFAAAALAIGSWRLGERRAGGIAVAALATAVVVFVGLVVGSGTLSETLGQRIEQLLASPQDARRFIWSGAWSMFLDHPWLGVGLDAFPIAFEHYRAPEYWNVFWNPNPKRAHNSVLQVAATQGAVGLVAGAVAIAGLGLGLRRAWRRAASQADRMLVFALAVAFAAFGLQGLFGFTVIALGGLVAISAGLVSALGREPLPAPPAPPRPLPAAVRGLLAATGGLLIAAAAYALVVAPLLANLRYTEGLALLGTARPHAAAAAFERAATLDPRREIYQVRLGGAHYAAARASREPTRQRRHLERARAAHERALAMVPQRSYNHVNLGRVLFAQAALQPPAATPAQALAAFRRALELDPYNAFALRDGADAAARLGRAEQARAWLERARERYPRWAPTRLLLGLLELRAGRFDAALAELETAQTSFWNDSGPYARQQVWAPLADARLGLGHADAALEAAREASTALPADPRPWVVRGRVFEQRGDVAAARAAYARALALEPRHGQARAALQRLGGSASAPSSPERQTEEEQRQSDQGADTE